MQIMAVSHEKQQNGRAPEMALKYWRNPGKMGVLAGILKPATKP